LKIIPFQSFKMGEASTHSFKDKFHQSMS